MNEEDANRIIDIIKPELARIAGFINRILSDFSLYEDDINYIYDQIERIISHFILLESYGNVSQDALHSLSSILELLKVALKDLQSSQASAVLPRTVSTGVVGRPRYDIPKETIEYLVNQHFTTTDIGTVVGVSGRTIKRCMEEHGIRTKDRYSSLQQLNEELTMCTPTFRWEP